jgi:hypothetical protein
VAAGADGLMIEVHPDPDHALSDGAQSLWPEQFDELDLWGANYYPGVGAEDCIEYTSLINIRPSQGNRSMAIEDETIQARVRDFTRRLIGEGEPLP